MLRNARLARQINYFTSAASRRPQQGSHGKFHSAILVGTVFSVTAAAVWLHLGQLVIRNDSKATTQEHKGLQLQATEFGDIDDLSCLVWGSNRNGLIGPRSTKAVRTPQLSPALVNAALRDLKLHEAHGAFIDARGDIYQWGSGFSQDFQPQRTLAGLDVNRLALTGSKLFALSQKTGKIYVLSSQQEKQMHSNPKRFWPWSVISNDRAVDYREINVRDLLMSGERFVTISAGSDHLVALTSEGRTFAMATSLRSNSHGQLGFRKAEVLLSGRSTPEQVELTPDAARDPLATATPFRRSSRELPAENTEIASNRSVVASIGNTKLQRAGEDSDISFCTILTEVPSLRGVKVSQIATGKQSTYARVDGRVLAWGANEYGQLGLGSNLTLSYVTAPTEISFVRGTSPGTTSSCRSIFAAGDVAYFLVRRQGLGTDDCHNALLACGHGQYGSLGNGLFSSAQADPSRIKTVSGLMEFSEKENKICPLEIRNLSASPTGHAMLTFETLARSGAGGIRGRDLVVWGQNKEYELGNGRRNIQAVPGNIPTGSEVPFMLLEKETLVKDLPGKRWARKALVEQTPVAGYGCSLIYWKIVS